MEKLEGRCLCGNLKWRYEAALTSVTACNCTACRRYGVLWAYDHEGEGIRVEGPNTGYERGSKHLGFHFCPTCGCLAYWRSNHLNDKGQRRIAVNVRLADEPDKVQHLLIDHFDGLGKFEDLPSDGKCVRDVWF